jgi:hypothetical protein
MATATSETTERSTRWPIRAAAAALLALLAAAAVAIAHGGSATGRPAGPFSWLQPAAAPSGWHVARTPSGAALYYPASWTKIETDPGTASAAPAGERGVFRGYLNATPQSGRETLANWHRFRVAHIASEGGRHIHLESSATGLRFRSGMGSCVVDRYTTSTTRFRELACIVAGHTGTAVVVGAAPVSRWGAQKQQLERAVSSFSVG